MKSVGAHVSMLSVREDKLVQFKVLRAPVWRCVLPSLSECVWCLSVGHISDQPGQISSLLHTCLLPGSCLALVMFLIWKRVAAFVLQACLLHLQLLKGNKNIKLWISGHFVGLCNKYIIYYDMIPIKGGAFRIQFAVKLNLNAIYEDHSKTKRMDNANVEQMQLWFLIYLKILK